MPFLVLDHQDGGVKWITGHSSSERRISSFPSWLPRALKSPEAVGYQRFLRELRAMAKTRQWDTIESGGKIGCLQPPLDAVDVHSFTITPYSGAREWTIWALTSKPNAPWLTVVDDEEPLGWSSRKKMGTRAKANRHVAHHTCVTFPRDSRLPRVSMFWSSPAILRLSLRRNLGW